MVPVNSIGDVLVPFAVVGCLLGFWYAVFRLPDRLVERRHRRRPQPTSPPIDELAARLNRLSAELQQVLANRVSARAHHVRVLQLAYDNTLVECLQALRPTDPVPAVPLDANRRVEVELVLTDAGLRW